MSPLRAVTIALVTALCSVVTGGCQDFPRAHTNGTDDYGPCQTPTNLSDYVKVQNAHVSRGEQNKGNPLSITGKATLTCPVALTRAFFEMKLEKQIDQNWLSVATNYLY